MCRCREIAEFCLDICLNTLLNPKDAVDYKWVGHATTAVYQESWRDLEKTACSNNMTK